VISRDSQRTPPNPTAAKYLRRPRGQRALFYGGASMALREVYDDSTGVIFYGQYMFQEDFLRAQVAEFVEWLKTSGLI